MNGIAVVLLVMIGLGFSPLLIPLVAAIGGALGDHLRSERKSAAQRIVEQAQHRAEVRRAAYLAATEDLVGRIASAGPQKP